MEFPGKLAIIHLVLVEYRCVHSFVHLCVVSLVQTIDRHIPAQSIEFLRSFQEQLLKGRSRCQYQVGRVQISSHDGQKETEDSSETNHDGSYSVDPSRRVVQFCVPRHALVN